MHLCTHSHVFSHSRLLSFSFSLLLISASTCTTDNIFTLRIHYSTPVSVRYSSDSVMIFKCASATHWFFPKKKLKLHLNEKKNWMKIHEWHKIFSWKKLSEVKVNTVLVDQSPIESNPKQLFTHQTPNIVHTKAYLKKSFNIITIIMASV